MTTMQAYFDGTVCVPLEKMDLKPNEQVTITVDRPQKSSIDRFFGILDDESAKSAMEALNDCRRIELNDW